MKFDKLSLFADGVTVPAASNGTTYSKVLDLRRCNLVDGLLKVYAQVVGAVNATGSVTTKLQVSEDAETWMDLCSWAQDGHVLAAGFFPIRGGRRFARLAFAVGAASLGSDVAVMGGLVDAFDVDELPKVSVNEDLASLGDALATGLVLSAASGTIKKGSSGTVKVVKGAVTTVIAPAKYTVTKSGDTVSIALAADAASGSVVFVDGQGAKHEYEVTASAS